MSKIDNVFHQRLVAQPQQSVSMIIRTQGDPTPHLPRLAELGLEVGHIYTLVPGISATGSAAAALSLLDEEWVFKVEEDKPVRTME